MSSSFLLNWLRKMPKYTELSNGNAIFYFTVFMTVVSYVSTVKGVVQGKTYELAQYV